MLVRSWVGKIPWGKAWQPTPVFFPEESHGQRNLAGHGPQRCKESDMTEVIEHTARPPSCALDSALLTCLINNHILNLTLG